MSDTTRTRNALWIVAPVALVLVAFLVLLATRDTADRRNFGRDLTGELAPELAGATLGGGSFDIDQHRGQFVIVNFFQTTCAPCIEEHPELVRFQERHSATGRATLVSVAFDDASSAIREFFAEFGGDWPILVDDTAQHAVNYAVTAVPESVIVAPNGEVIAKLISGVTVADLESRMIAWEDAQFIEQTEDGS